MSGMRICENYANMNQSMNDFEVNIGYSKLTFSRYCFIIIPSLGILINLFVIINYLRKKRDQRESSTSMEKMIYVLTLIQLFISSFWVSNGILFYHVREIINNCFLCFFYSLSSIFLHTLYLFFFIATFHNLRTILNNPVDGILKFNKRFITYITTSICFASLVTYMSYETNSYGISPMLTCYLRNYFQKNNTTEVIPFIFVLVGCIIIITISIYLVYLGLAIYNHKLTNGKRHFKKFFMKYLVYGLIFILFNIPTLLLYLVTINQKIYSPSFYSYLSYLSALSNITIDFGLCCVNIFFGHVKFGSVREEEDNKNTMFINTTLYLSEIESEPVPKLPGDPRSLSKRFSFHSFENEVMENVYRNINKFLRDMFIGICHTLTTNRNIDVSKTKLSSFDCQYHQKFKIKKEHIKFEDETIRSVDKISIHFTTFAPYVFKRLIYLENMNEDDLIKSLLPMKNKLSISESQGKSGNFFINTDDNEFILKTITDDELNLITTSFIKKYAKYLSKNKDSLLCRLYGLFQITLIEKHVNVILMKNVAGKCKPNIICSYDLKGSTLNRQVTFDMERVQKIVMKDNNFEEIEKFLYLDQYDRLKLQQITKNDSEFLNKLGLMDYSLLVLKLSIKENEVLIEKLIKIENIKGLKENVSSAINKYLYKSIHPGSAYIISIIDYFQLYNFFKLMETNIKFYIGARPDKVTDISCVPPDVYSKRFVEYIERITNFNIIEMSQKDEIYKSSTVILDKSREIELSRSDTV